MKNTEDTCPLCTSDNIVNENYDETYSSLHDLFNY